MKAKKVRKLSKNDIYEILDHLYEVQFITAAKLDRITIKIQIFENLLRNGKSGDYTVN